MQQIDWWQAFPDHFYQQSFHPNVEKRHKFKIKSIAALDIVLRTGLAGALFSAMVHNFSSKEKIQQEISYLEFYKQFAGCNNPSLVFKQPPKNIEIQQSRGGKHIFSPRGVDRVDLLSFMSPFQTLNPEMNQTYQQSSRNRRSVVQHWRHHDGIKPTLIFIHGVSLDSYRLNSMLFELEWLYRQGYDILLYTLPFHGYRKEQQQLLNGMGYFSQGFAHINEAMLQAVYDLRLWMNYLESQNVQKMGLMGFSLGAYICALTTSVDDRLSFSIPYAPVVLPVDMMLGWQPFSWIVRQLLKKNHLNIQELRQATALHHALNWKPAIDAKRLLILGGAGDRFVAPHYVNTLHQHWKGSEIQWYAGNHLLYLNHERMMRKIKKFMDQCCSD